MLSWSLHLCRILLLQEVVLMHCHAYPTVLVEHYLGSEITAPYQIQKNLSTQEKATHHFAIDRLVNSNFSCIRDQ
jgi:hypothetical protein